MHGPIRLHWMQRGSGRGGGVVVLPTFVKTFQDGQTIGQLSCSPEKVASKSENVATDECSSIEDQLYTVYYINVNKLIAKTLAVSGEVEIGTTRSHEKPQTSGHGSRSPTSPT